MQPLKSSMFSFDHCKCLLLVAVTAMYHVRIHSVSRTRYISLHFPCTLLTKLHTIDNLLHQLHHSDPRPPSPAHCVKCWSWCVLFSFTTCPCPEWMSLLSCLKTYFLIRIKFSSVWVGTGSKKHFSRCQVLNRIAT